MSLREQHVWPAIVGVIFAVEIWLATIVYRSCDLSVALIALGGVPVLALVDWLARRRTAACRPTWYRRHLAAWSLVPFFCGVAGTAWVHYQKRLESLDDIRQVSGDIRQAVTMAWPELAWGHFAPNVRAGGLVWDCRNDAPRDLSAAQLDQVIASVITARFTPSDPKSALVELKGQSAMRSEEARRFGELARVAGNDLRRACGDVELLDQRARADTLQGFALAVAIQALFVMWIPVMLAVSISRAAGRRRRSAPAGTCESLRDRDDRILAEDRYLFVPRFCFGALLVLGTNYVFAPFGLRATYVMAIVDEHALAGHTSWALWSTSFAEVPVIVVGFVGFLLYALITATQRFALDDLDDQAVLTLLVRGLVVILLCFALSSSPMNDVVERIFVFVAGVFPLRALEALAKKANVAIDPDFDGAVSSFDGLPSLDPVKVFALRSAGIQSTYDLAATPIEEIAERVRIDPRLLGRAVDRAILIDALGIELARRLERFAITSATELVALKDAMPALDEPVTQPAVAPAGPPSGLDAGPAFVPAPPAGSTQLRDAATRVAHRLATDQRVARIRTWLAGSPRSEVAYLDAVKALPLPAKLPVADARVVAPADERTS